MSDWLDHRLSSCDLRSGLDELRDRDVTLSEDGGLVDDSLVDRLDHVLGDDLGFGHHSLVDYSGGDVDVLGSDGGGSGERGSVEGGVRGSVERGSGGEGARGEGGSVEVGFVGSGHGSGEGSGEGGSGEGGVVVGVGLGSVKHDFGVHSSSYQKDC